MMRINKFIAKSGITSRRRAEDLILSGQIEINGLVINELSYRVKAEDVVKYKGQIISPVEEKYYIKLNKPAGYTSTNADVHASKIIFDLVDIDTRLFSIGRLDRDSRGLILLTNDGDIYNKIMHPSRRLYKKYLVKLNKVFDFKDKNQLASGLDIGGYITQPCRLGKIKENKLEISIFEGKNRQIRRMFACLGYEVVDLKRIEIGEISLGNLKEGSYCFLSQSELDYLRSL